LLSIQHKMVGTKVGWEKRRENGNDIPYNKGKKGLQVAWNKGLTKEDNSSISKMGFQKGHQFNKGEKSYLWKGGITPENVKIRNSIQMKLWREALLIRDNFTCQKCGQNGGKLQAHHILNFSIYLDLRFDINNGIILCKKCHKEFHKIYGRKDNTQEQLIKFLQYTA